MCDLKKCPFCGGKAEIVKSKPSTARFNEGAIHFSVACFGFNCGVMPYPKLWHVTESDAILAWNTRATDNTITEQEKVISELVDKIQLNTEILTAIMERKPLQGSDYHAISCTIKNNELLIAKHKQSKGE